MVGASTDWIDVVPSGVVRVEHALGWHVSDWSAFELRLDIEGGVRVLKNSKRIVRFGKGPTARMAIVASPQSKRYQASASAQLREQWRQVFAAPIPLNVPVNARIVAYLPTRRRVDLSNVYQGPEDALQHAGVLYDDWQIAGHDGSRRRYDKAAPRVEITLTRAEDGDE